jgi:hypothetical protein
MRQVESMLAESPLRPIAAYDGFSMRPASRRSERIHWVTGIGNDR